MRDPYDRGSKWLIGHHGGALLQLGGASGFTSWRAVQAEVVAPKHLPDGLLEVYYPGQTEPDLYLVEVSTYPERDAERQAVEDALFVYLDRDRLPDVLILVLCPRGTFRVGDRREVDSAHGWTRLGVRWRVVELWTLSAADLLATNNVGLIPWVPLAHSDEPPETVLRECCERIDRQAPAERRDNFLAVTAMLASLRYDESLLQAIFLRNRSMLEFPLLTKWLADPEVIRQSPALPQFEAAARHRDIVRCLTVRFQAVPPEVRSALAGVIDPTWLDELIDWAVRCPDLDAFRARLTAQGT